MVDAFYCHSYMKNIKVSLQYVHASLVYSFQVLENISTILQNLLGAQERYVLQQI